MPSSAGGSKAPPTSASSGLVAHDIQDLIGVATTNVTSDALLALDPNAKSLDPVRDNLLPQVLNLCQAKAAQGIPTSVANTERMTYCLLAVASEWVAYLDVVAEGRPATTQESAFQAAVTAYGYTVGALGPGTKAPLDAALTAAFSSGSKTPSVSPSGLHTLANLLAKPHKVPTAASLGNEFGNAIRSDLVAAVGSFKIGGVYGSKRATALDACLVGVPGDSGETKTVDRLGGCQSLAEVMWKTYKISGQVAYWTAAKAAFEAGYAIADPSCYGTTCRNEYLQSYTPDVFQ